MNFLRMNSRTIIYSAIYAMLFTVFMAFGDALSSYDTIFINYFNFHPVKYSLVFWGMSFAGYLLLNNLDKIQNWLENLKVFPKLDKTFFTPNKKSFLYCFLFILCCHIPAFLAHFPGIWAYDVLFQIHFFIDHDYIEIHPLIHNIMIYWAWLLQKNYPHLLSGMFLYTLIQFFIIIGIYAFYIRILSKYKYPKIIKICSLLFFALYPANQIFPLVATKDVLFVGFVILTILLLFELCYDKSFLKNLTKPLFLIISTTLMLLFRHNALYSYILALPFLIYLYVINIKMDFKKILSMLFIPLVFYFCFGILKQELGIKPPAIASSVSIPLQQMGRVRIVQKDFLSSEDKNDWVNIVSKYNELNYNKHTVDWLKFDREPVHMQHSYFLDNSIKNHPERFINLWMKWGKLYPKDYTDAFLLNNFKYWYIGGKYRFGYPGCYLFTVGYHDFYDVVVPQINFIPDIKEYYFQLFMENTFQNNLLTFVFLSIAWNSWILLACFMILLYQKRYRYCLILCIIPALFLGVLFGPTVVVRYIYQNYLILPLVLAFCFSKNDIQKKIHEISA